MSFGKIETWEAETSHALDPLWPYASDYDLHQKAGGLPLASITAPNVRLPSWRKAGGLQTGNETNVPINKCGSKRTHYAPGRKKISLPLLLLLLRHKARP